MRPGSAVDDALDPAAIAHAVSAAAAAAEDVDRRGRFPAEAVLALRQGGLLGAHVPAELGGAGMGMVDIAFRLGGACASAAMVYAMHQIQVACLVRHAAGTPALRGHLARIAHSGFLLASVTSEAGVGGDIRTSACAIEPGIIKPGAAGSVRVVKRSTAISYGAHADGLLVTARRAPDAAPSDQVAVLLFTGDYTLERTGTWDAMGMRGTCSDAFLLQAECPADQVLPVPFADIAADSMLPVAHLLWAGVWLGIAADALHRARACTRRARTPDGSLPPAAGAVAGALSTYRMAEARWRLALDDYEAGRPVPPLEWNGLKVGVSEAALDVVTQAMRICGIAGFRNDSPYSIARHLRDIMSSVVMVGNERILANSGALVLMQAPHMGLA